MLPSCRIEYLTGSTRRLTLTGCRSRLDRIQHPMARDRVVERGAQMRAIAIVASETRVRLGDVGGGARALRRRPPILLWDGQGLERRLRALAATYGHLENLGLATGCGELQVALGAVDLPEQVDAARNAAAIVDRECGTTLKQPADGHLVLGHHWLGFTIASDRE